MSKIVPSCFTCVYAVVNHGHSSSMYDPGEPSHMESCHLPRFDPTDPAYNQAEHDSIFDGERDEEQLATVCGGYNPR